MKAKRIFGIILIAFIIAVLIRLFIVDTIVVASDAMHESYKVGDMIIVEKLTLGPRLPQVVKLPFASQLKYCDKPFVRLSENHKRLNGLSNLEINDIVVYNDPSRLQMGMTDLSPTLFSRCAGLPGDTIFFEGTSLFVNNNKISRPIDITSCYSFKLNNDIGAEELIKKTYPKKNIFKRDGCGFVFLTKFEFIKISLKNKNISNALKPYKSTFDMKKISLPYKGMVISINEKSIHDFKDILTKYENVRIWKNNKKEILIDGKNIDKYTFKNDYLWLMNDHQGFLNDSRSFGPIPKNLIIGKAFLVMFSPEKKRLLQKIQ